jgi:hypothetical protein
LKKVCCSHAVNICGDNHKTRVQMCHAIFWQL